MVTLEGRGFGVSCHFLPALFFLLAPLWHRGHPMGFSAGLDSVTIVTLHTKVGFSNQSAAQQQGWPFIAMKPQDKEGCNACAQKEDSGGSTGLRATALSDRMTEEETYSC